MCSKMEANENELHKKNLEITFNSWYNHYEDTFSIRKQRNIADNQTIFFF